MTAEPILITGVGRRLGLHLARGFLGRGIPVIGTYRTLRDGVRELEELGATLRRCDFYDDTQVERLIESVKHKNTSLRAIIHNASDWSPDDDPELDSGAVMQRMMQVHVSVPYRLNLALAPLLANRPRAGVADIIHIGDYVSSKGSRKHIAYAASKAAQDNLTLSFAARLAPRVKVNSIAPSLVLFNDGDNDAYRAKTLDKSLMKREAGLDEFHAAVDYLLQSRYVTGRVLPLDGGRHIRAT